MFTNALLVSYLAVSVLVMLFLTRIAVKTFQYPEFNHENEWENSVERICFILGTIITVVLFSSLWIIVMPIIIVYLIVRKK